MDAASRFAPASEAYVKGYRAASPRPGVHLASQGALVLLLFLGSCFWTREVHYANHFVVAEASLEAAASQVYLVGVAPDECTGIAAPLPNLKETAERPIASAGIHHSISLRDFSGLQATHISLIKRVVSRWIARSKERGELVSEWDATAPRGPPFTQLHLR